ncbi:short-chain dehydrogenase/reductase family 16C member 6-like [Diaphorina citri]|uniref:Short-chain dehydrogenase/reductase family 16C member 6-like n=1 Tax=Diaphorina citri TaxID=121845 RepID=A0A3Q0IV77_DIACI|nr:short-chain dehydrogenase/reductase family 16C member 6-like [Diaphorina citri]
MLFVSSIYSTAGLLIELYCLGVKIFLAFLESAYRCVHPKPLKRLNTERVLVIGTGRGIGRELALQLSCHGAEVICWDIDEKLNQATVNETKHLNGKAFAFTCDVTSRADCRISSYFNTMDPGEAARLIINGVRRNAAEISIPENALLYSKLLRMLPRKSSQIIRELLDTGVDFG